MQQEASHENMRLHHAFIIHSLYQRCTMRGLASNQLLLVFNNNLIIMSLKINLLAAAAVVKEEKEGGEGPGEEEDYCIYTEEQEQVGALPAPED